MFCLGFMGNQTLSREELDRLERLEGIRLSGIQPGGDAGRLKECDALVFDDDTAVNYDLIVTSLRESRHMLIPNPVFLDRHRVNVLVKLAEEANVALQFRQPIHCIPAMKGLAANLHNPRYIEVNRKIGQQECGTDIRSGMCRALTECIDASLIGNRTNLRKFKVFRLPVTEGVPELIHSRLELDDACIINIRLNRFPGREHFEGIFYQNGLELRADLLNNEISLIRTAPGERESHHYEAGSVQDALFEETRQFISVIRSGPSRQSPGINGQISFIVSNNFWHQMSPSPV